MARWVPIDTAMTRELPHDRPFTRLEAMFSLTVDFDRGSPVTLTGYAAQWRWSPSRVKRFLAEVGVEIVYPESTGKRQNQRGMIMCMKPEGKRNDNGMINLIDLNRLQPEPEGKRNENEMKTEGSCASTKRIKTGESEKSTPYIPQTGDDLSALFDEFWQTYPKRVGKEAARKAFCKLKPDALLSARMVQAIERQKQTDQWQRDGGQFIPNPATWLNQKRWEDETGGVNGGGDAPKPWYLRG